jgi:hypothetical protein
MNNSPVFGRSGAVTSLLLVLGIFFVVGFACNSGSKPPPSEYVGMWSGQDGSLMTIRGDATGDYKSGGTTVSGGAVEIDEAAKSLSIKFIKIGPSFTIDKAPSGNQMTLSGVVYKKNGGSTSGSDTSKSTGSDDKSTSSDDKSTSGSEDMPSDSEIQDLAHETTSQFADAIDTDDFGDLYDNASKDFQRTYTEDEVKSGFKTYRDNRKILLPILKKAVDKEVDLSPPPYFRTEHGTNILCVEGTYKLGARSAVIDYEYVMQDSEWKMLVLKINVK